MGDKIINIGFTEQELFLICKCIVFNIEEGPLLDIEDDN